MGAEHRGDRGQHARPVVDGDVQVVLRAQLVDGPDGGSAERRGTAGATRPQVVGGVDEVPHDGAGRRHAAGAPAVEHELAHRLALDEHRVERVPHRSQRVGQGDHRRVDANGDLPVRLLGDGQELDHVSEAAGEGDVLCADPADALAVDVPRHDLHPERDAGDDGGLGSGVESLDVRRRVPLGEAEALGLGQGVGVGRAFLGHPGEDVVGRAVEDAHEPHDALAREALPERTDQRDPATH